LIGQAHAIRLAVERTGGGMPSTGARALVQVRARVWYNPDLVSAYFMVPALIGMILQLMTSMLTATSIVRERERGRSSS